MSNPDPRPDEVVCRSDGHTDPGTPCPGTVPVEVITSRDVPLGGLRAMSVRRTLPQRARSLIGAWCFAVHYGPDDVSRTGGMDVAPHPHTGLQTVSWLFAGEIRHVDSGGTAALVRPGELNLMTSGRGICHSETSTEETGVLHGVQLWLALPDRVREEPDRSFDHHRPDPVRLAGDDGRPGGEALVFLGSLAGVTSPVRTHTPLLGAELRLDPGGAVVLDVDPAFEHGLLVDSGAVRIEDVAIPVAALGYTGVGARRLRIVNDDPRAPARAVLLGGEPFAEPIVMWWNFVGRDGDEIRRYREEWQAGSERFGRVEGYVGHGGPGRNADGLGRLPAPELPHATLRPRANPAPEARAGTPADLASAPGGTARTPAAPTDAGNTGTGTNTGPDTTQATDRTSGDTP